MSLKILLADDSMTAQNMGKKILVDGGYEVVAVSNGAAAIKKLAEFTPDLVIADVYMPGYNGLEICERIKKSHASVPVLLSVGKLEPFRPEDGVKVHADGIIIKPFEATDLLAVTAKLAERVGKAAPQTSSAPADQESDSTDEAEQPESKQAIASATVEETPVAEATADVPAFGLEEFSPAPAPTFAVEAHQPDYVREFGLDPHDAPTTMFRVPVSAKPTSQEAPFTNEAIAECADLEEFQAPVSEFEPVTPPPASLNLAINNAFSAEAEAELDDQPEVLADTAVVEEPAELPVFAEPTVAADPSHAVAEVEVAHDGEVAHDDFETKLAAAMAEYEAPATQRAEVEPATVDDADAAAEPPAPVQEFTAVAPVWVAEEAPLTAADHALNLEQEFRAFAAAASSAAAVRPAIAPVGPLGDTSVDDEVASVVEESKELFFPSALTDRMNAPVDGFKEMNTASADLPVTEAPDDFAALQIDGPLADPIVTEFPQTDDWGASALEDEAMLAEPATFPDHSGVVDHFGSETAAVNDLMNERPAGDFAPNDADVPELITHDVPTEWNSGVVLDEVSPEAPFAHFAAEEVAAEQPSSPTAEMVAATMHEAMSEEAVAQEAMTPEVVSSVVSQAAENLATDSAHSALTLDHAAISEAVERVMDRMKTDLVAQIAKELAAKLGK